MILHSKIKEDVIIQNSPVLISIYGTFWYDTKLVVANNFVSSIRYGYYSKHFYDSTDYVEGFMCL